MSARAPSLPAPPWLPPPPPGNKQVARPVAMPAVLVLTAVAAVRMAQTRLTQAKMIQMLMGREEAVAVEVAGERSKCWCRGKETSTAAPAKMAAIGAVVVVEGARQMVRREGVETVAGAAGSRRADLGAPAGLNGWPLRCVSSLLTSALIVAIVAVALTPAT